MGVIKKHTPGSQPVDIRSLSLGVTTQATDPIIEIINGDQQNIGPALPHLLIGKQASRQAYKCKGEKTSFNHSICALV
jgi:hypothetical protein